MLLARHRALIALALLGACGSDDAFPRETARLDGLTVGGELGFRYGEPLDIDGDGDLDIVGGSRYGGAYGYGEASVWSHGEVILHWDSDELDGLFGSVTLAMPDLDGDGTPDVVISAPNAALDGVLRGHVDAYSGRDGGLLWRTDGAMYDGFGWHIDRAPDLDGDGVADLWVGAPSNPSEGHAYLVSGRTGAIVQTFVGPGDSSQYGWYVVALGDDVAIGAPTEQIGGGVRGAVHVMSRDGTERLTIPGEIVDQQYGEMIAALDDLDGDGMPELAVASPGNSPTIASEVSILSGATGERLRLLTQGEPGELYGRMLASVPDLDGDGIRELALGAPWWSGRNGRIEIRSPTNLSVLAEVHGDEQGWLGWHISAAGDDGMLASQLHARADTGALELFELK